MKENVTFLVPGIRNKDYGESTVGVLRDELLIWGVKSVIVNYGYIFLPITNGRARKAVRSALIPFQGDRYTITAVGYSNGCPSILEAMKGGLRVDHLVLISPALKRNYPIPDSVRSVTVFHSRGDKVITAGGIKSAVSEIMPYNWECLGFDDNPWGTAGRYGLLEQDSRVVNIELADQTAHAFYNHPAEVRRIAATISRLQQEE